MNPSLTDFLTGKGMDASPEARASLYEKEGLGKATDYLDAYNKTKAGTGNNADLNTNLLNKLRGNNQLIVTGNDYRTKVGASSTALDGALRAITAGQTPPPTGAKGAEAPTPEYSDSFTKLLDSMTTRSNETTKSLLSTINAQYANRQNEIGQTYDRYKRGLQLLGIEEGRAAATPELLQGQILQAENEHQSKIRDLDAEETKALLDAQTARDDQNFKLMKEKMDYVQQIKKDKANALKDYYDTLISGQNVSKGLAPGWYDTIANVTDPNERMTVIQAIADQYKLPVSTVVSALADEKAVRDKADLAAENTRSIIKKRTSAPSGPGSGKNYTAENIPDAILKDLTDDLANSEATLTDLFALYPEVSTSYLTSLYGAYHKSGASNPFE